MDDGLAAQLQQELEAKQCELEELQASIAKARNDYARRQDAVKREAEDKVAFLVQQLRQAESRAAESRASLSQSQSQQSQTPSYSTLNTSRTAETSSHTVPQTPTQQHSSNITRLSDTFLTRASREDLLGAPPQHQHEEILRRWQAEKERREILERANGALHKELRELRAKSR